MKTYNEALKMVSDDYKAIQDRKAETGWFDKTGILRKLNDKLEDKCRLIADTYGTGYYIVLADLEAMYGAL